MRYGSVASDPKRRKGKRLATGNTPDNNGQWNNRAVRGQIHVKKRMCDKTYLWAKESSGMEDASLGSSVDVARVEVRLRLGSAKHVILRY